MHMLARNQYSTVKTLYYLITQIYPSLDIDTSELLTLFLYKHPFGITEIPVILEMGCKLWIMEIIGNV